MLLHFHNLAVALLEARQAVAAMRMPMAGVTAYFAVHMAHFLLGWTRLTSDRFSKYFHKLAVASADGPMKMLMAESATLVLFLVHMPVSCRNR